MARAGVVDLSDMKLERVPLELAVTKSCEGDASNLPVRCLILKNNRLVYLPSSLFACNASVDHDYFGTKMKDGAISRCSDCEEGPLGGLRVLDVAINRLSTVPSTIACLASLTVLNLTSNRLTSLPPEIGRLVNLRDLYLCGNELTQLPDQIGSCRGLRRLYLTANPLRSLPLGMGSLLDELIVLELSGAQATLTFPPKAVVKRGIQAILAHLAQARAEQSRKESLERRRAAFSSLGDAAATQDSYSAAEREKQAWREGKARQREEMAHMERSVRLAEVRNRRLDLDKEHLQRKMIDLMIDKRRLQQRVEEMEERTSREEIRRHCVVCMDHTRSHVLMPCRHYIVCQYCANNIRVCPVCRSPITEKLQVFDV